MGPTGVRRPQVTDPILQVFLSLFVLLVAFFVLLNAISTFEKDRTDRVIESVDAAFPADTPPPIAVELGGVGGGASDRFLFGELRALFAAYLELKSADLASDGRSLRITVGHDQLFDGGRLALEEGLQPLFQRLSGLLGLKTDGRTVRMDVLVGVSDQGVVLTDSASPDARAPAPIREAADVVRKLIADGAPEVALGAGLIQGRPEVVQFIFTILPPAAPDLSLGEAEERGRNPRDPIGAGQ